MCCRRGVLPGDGDRQRNRLGRRTAVGSDTAHRSRDVLAADRSHGPQASVGRMRRVVPVTPDDERLRRLVSEIIERAGLDLGGLVVYTEAASGPYAWPPLLAAMAGARRVHALARDSRFHRAADVIAATERLARSAGLAHVVRVHHRKLPCALAEADIVTNSGAVRPIDSQTVAALKPTAVIALMWETWELRPWHVDLDACRRRDVLVLGTYERTPAFDMRPYIGLLGLRLLFELGLEVHATRTLLLGRHPLIGEPVERALRAAGAIVTCFSRRGDGGDPYELLNRHFSRHGAAYDALVVAEHAEPALLLGDGG